MKRAILAMFAAAGLLTACGQGGSSSSVATSTQAKTLLAALPAPYNAADLANGEAHFSLCKSCHTIAEGGANMTGPNLYGVVGRKAAAKADYKYSDALRAKDLTWDPATLDQWLASPQSFVPGTKMSFPGLKDANDRRDVIAYLKVASGT